MGFKIAIVDDEQEIRDMIASYVEQYGQEHALSFHIEKFKNGLSLLAIDHFDYNIVLMDIDMPHMNGIETAAALRKDNRIFTLAFITNHLQFAVDGYSVKASDYIVKPVSYETFAFKFEQLLSYATLNKKSQIMIKTPHSIQLLDTNDIYYVEVMKHELYYHTVRGIIKTWGTLKNATQELTEQGFSLCNSCYLVNLFYVDEIYDDYIVVHGESLKTSTAKKKSFLLALMNYMKGNA